MATRLKVSKPSLNVSLTPEHGRFIAERMASGDYQTASEVVRAGLRLLKAAETRKAPPGLADGQSRMEPRNAPPSADGAKRGVGDMPGPIDGILRNGKARTHG